MDTKKIILLVGGLAVVGTAIYLITKKPKDVASGGLKSATATTPTTTTDGTTTDVAGTTSTGIKGLKGKDKKGFKKDAQSICTEKYGKGKDYRDCMKRLKTEGGVAFDGSFEYFNDDNFGL
jgi:hypothetical protein